MEAVAVKKSRPAKAAKAAKPVEAIICYKGTDANMRCNGYQYELGKTFTHTGTVAACSQGFHSCENPLDVWNYYGVADGNRFFKVRASGKLDRHSGDSKVASAEIHFEAELKFPDFIKMAVKWVMDAAKDKGDSVQSSTIKNSKLAASGDSSQLDVTGKHSAAAAVAPGCAIKGIDGTPIAICEYDDGKPVGFVCGIIGQDGLKADTWYRAQGGKLVEA